MNIRLLAIACPSAVLLALLSLPVNAQTEPGDEWETTTSMQMQGMSMPARTQKVCTPRNSQDPPGVPEPDDGDCEMYDVNRTGSTMKWKMRCTGKQAVTGSGEMTYQGTDNYDGKMTMTMDGQTMNMAMKGKRTGKECDAGKIKRDMANVQAQSDKMVAQQCAAAAEGMQVMVFDGSYPTTCDAKSKAEFCRRVSTEEGYDLLAVRGVSPMSKKTDLQSAGATCNVDTAALQIKLCKNAVTSNSLLFMARHCPSDAAPLAQRECAGRNFTNPPAEKYREFCSAYAQHGLTADTPPGSDAAAPGQPADAPKEGAVEKSKKALKKFLPF